MVLPLIPQSTMTRDDYLTVWSGQVQLGLCDMTIYRMDEIKSILFHIVFYRLFCGVAKYMFMVIPFII